MLSMPPATTISALPVWIACCARATAFSPEPQTLLMVMAPTLSGSPPPSAAWRAGFCPSPAGHHVAHDAFVDACSGSMPARFTASRTTMAPSCGALKSDKRTLKFSDRRAHRRNDHHIFHEAIYCQLLSEEIENPTL